ncbi:hypothetical protein Sste5346_008934 [Sporothrix stenoceras]|uniref:Uncharacterized protein n=1 Tax=Sporothrix stenoceras TaxID=5173 RepID=A0ABR3YMF0_9PEZI
MAGSQGHQAVLRALWHKPDPDGVAIIVDDTTKSLVMLLDNTRLGDMAYTPGQQLLVSV